MIRDLIEALPQDPWRERAPFSADVRACHDVLFRPGAARFEMAAALDQWLAAEQPCRFGRMEANREQLAYCLLTENDLERGDEHVRSRIQEDRDDWKREALGGGSHGFIILAISRRIAHAMIGPDMLRLARHLCGLNLGRDDVDRILLDDLILEIQTEGGRAYRSWSVGVNYFSAQADGLWWRDHRIPGGMGFSTNSVGHMARTRAEAMLAKSPLLADGLKDAPRDRLTYWALPTAMKTIGPPIDGGKRGTCLAERGRFPEDREPPTFEQRSRVFGELAGFSENRYLGRYHTDETIPSPYFDPSVTRLTEATQRDDLYFTYLHSPGDPDYTAMGLGALIQANEEERQAGRTEGGDET